MRAARAAVYPRYAVRVANAAAAAATTRANAAQQMHCLNGHQDWYVSPEGRRQCRVCKRESLKRWRAANPDRAHP